MIKTPPQLKPLLKEKLENALSNHVAYEHHSAISKRFFEEIEKRDTVLAIVDYFQGYINQKIANEENWIKRFVLKAVRKYFNDDLVHEAKELTEPVG